MTIKVGDYVTWRGSPRSLGFTGCKVLELAKSDGRDVARLDLGRFNRDEPIWALVEQLHSEPGG